MSSEQREIKPEETKSERRTRLLKSANATLITCLVISALWLYVYNLVVHRMNPVLAFFKILDGVNELVVGMLTVVAIGLGIVFVYTLTNLFTQTITNLYSVRILEDMIRDHLMKKEFRVFIHKLIHFGDQPQPESPFPRFVSSTILVLSYHYVIAWFYLVVFTESLYFAAWSAGVYLDLYPSTMNTIPMFAIAVPFTARLMAAEITGWVSVVLEPATRMTSAFSISEMGFVMAPLPNAAARPATVEECHNRAQWSTLFVLRTVRANFWAM